MAGYPPPYPPSGPPSPQDLKYQRRVLRDQAHLQREQYRYQRRALRRRSIVGPIFFILIGIVFFLVQTGHLHAYRLWMLLGRWWPLLLVLMGVILIVEWAIDRARPHDPQQIYGRRSIGGGVIILIVLLVIVGSVSSRRHDGHPFFSHGLPINPDNFEEFFGNRHESEESRVAAFPANGMLTVDNPHGDVKISGTSTDNQIHISVHKQVYSYSDSEAESKARELMPRISSSGQTLSIIMPALTAATTDITITTPADAGTTVTANHGDIRIDSLKDPVTVTANHGDITLAGIKNAVNVHLNHGGSTFSAHDITGPLSLEGHGQDLILSAIDGPVTIAGDFYGSSHLEHITGSIKYNTSRTDFQLARLDGAIEISPDADLSIDQAVGPVVLTTRNRNIRLDHISGDVSVNNRNGSVDLTSVSPLGNITIQNRNGSVGLILPDKSSFTLNAETSDGEMDNDFKLTPQEQSNRKTLTGTIGKGNSLIRINTSQGDVSVKKASIASLPSHPPESSDEPAISINDRNGDSVYVGKDGVRIIDGTGSNKIIVGNKAAF